MKRIAFVLAAAVLGTGCIWVDDDDCSSSSLAVDWTFQLSDGTTAGCAAADVDFVDLYLGGQFIESADCGQGGTTIRVVEGSHVLTVEGIDSAGRIAYRDVVNVQAAGCGTRAIAVRPTEGTVNLDYSAACTVSPCFLWFSVFDEVAGTLAAVIGDTSPASLKEDFPYPEDVRIRLAAGTYTLEWMELVSRSGVTYAGELISCAPQGFDVQGAGLTTLPVDLACLP